MRIAVLASGRGSNLQALIENVENGFIPAEIALVVSDKAEAPALNRASQHGIERAEFTDKDFPGREIFDRELAGFIKAKNIDLICLAGFMRILGTDFVGAFPNGIINIHPSLIPAFCGKGYYGIIPHQKALEYGVKVTGATVHFVDVEADSGPIILQKAVYIRDDDTPETLQKRVMEEAEWEILPEAIKLFAEGRLEIDGRKVRIKDN